MLSHKLRKEPLQATAKHEGRADKHGAVPTREHGNTRRNMRMSKIDKETAASVRAGEKRG